ncbi:MAG: hypothetical protein APF81_13345 [Desulfosporosinus sp. BRH_c37]|nr:MAG: hypothetical protein APF81_13345 [Desulfosporosinus sp. BRH_c37]
MKTQEELKHELYMQTTEVENALVKLDKASLILGHWMNEYVFTERPDPGEAVKRWTARTPEEKPKNGDQSVKWFYEYSRIIGFIDIVQDYVFESKKLLEKVANGEKRE